PRTPCCTLFPYTTLFRSLRPVADGPRSAARDGQRSARIVELPRAFSESPPPPRDSFPSTHRRGKSDQRRGHSSARDADALSQTLDRKSTRLNSSHVSISY